MLHQRIRRLGWSGSDCTLVVAVLAMCVVAAWAAVGDTLGAVAVAAVVSIPLWFGLLKLSVFDLTVALLPLMFYVDLSGPVNVAASDALLIPLVVVTMVKLSTSRRESGLVSTALVSTALAYALVLLGAMTVSLTVAELRDAEVGLASGLGAIVKVTICVLYFWCAIVHFSLADESDTLRTIRVWTVVATVIAGFSLLDQFRLIPAEAAQFRDSGTFEDPNLYAAYLLVSAVLGAWANARRHGRLFGVNTVVLLAATATTASRGAILTVAAAVVVLCAIRIARGVTLASIVRGVAAAAVVVLAFMLGAVPAFLATRLSSQGAGASEIRLSLWQAAFRAWTDHPVFGIGPGQFLPRSRALANVSHEYVTHNTFVDFLVEGGIVGLFAFVSLGVVMMVRIRRAHHLSPHERTVLWVAVAVIGVEMLTLNLQNARFVWVLGAFILAMATLVRPPAAPEPQTRVALGATGSRRPGDARG